MKSLDLKFLAGLACLVQTAFPASPTTQQLATFDDRTSVPSLSEINPVGIYKGLKYAAFDVLQAGIGGVNAVKAQSGANVAANGVTDNLVSSPNITSAYPGSAVSSFDLQYLYFGCVGNTVETLASVPVDCTVSFTVYKISSSSAFQTLDIGFTPSNPLISVMTKATFPSTWTYLQHVDIAVVAATTTATLTGLLMDNVAYETRSL